MQFIYRNTFIGVELIMQKIKQDISLGNNIRTLRKQSHFTQEQIVARMQLQGIEISRSSYSQIECGTYNIRVSELIALANIFNVDFNAFLLIYKTKTPSSRNSTKTHYPYCWVFYICYNHISYSALLKIFLLSILSVNSYLKML